MHFAYITIQHRSTLSKLGFNCNYVDNRLISYSDAVAEIIHFRDKIIKKDIDIIYDICENRLIKKQCFFKGVWTCRNNIYPKRLVKLLDRNENRQIIVDRLQMIIYTLTHNI